MASTHYVAIVLVISVVLKSTTIDAQNPGLNDKEEQFVNKMKDYWIKVFGNVQMPPSIKASTCNQPPPKEVMDALKELGSVENNISPEEEKSEAIAEIAALKEASSSSKKLKPRVEERLAQMLAKILQGPKADQESVADTKSLIEQIMSGSHTFVDMNAVQNKLDETEKKRLKEAISSSMAGGDKLQDGKLGAAMKAMGVGYGGDHSTSTLLAVSKCMGLPNVDNSVHDKSVESLFFVQAPHQDVTAGLNMQLQFKKGTNNGAFTQSLEEDTTGVMSAILLMDLVTMLAKIMDKKQTPDITAEMDTVLICDGNNNGGENGCVMNLESMVTKTKAMLGQDIQPTATCITKDSPASVGYTLKTVKKLPAMKTVGCNKMGFPFAVFYCKDLPQTVNYAVFLTGDDGSSRKSVIICHEDTSKWNPKSWIFSTLKTKPGAGKICHFLAADDVAWLPKTQDTIAA